MPATETPAAAAAALRCAHCGLPVPPGLRVAEGTPAFCCAGCATVYEVLRSRGLEAYYALPERRLAPVRASGRGFEEYDHASYHDLYVRRRADGLLETEFYLEGVHCGSCVWLVERVPLLLPGLGRVELDLPRSRVQVAWDGGTVALSAIARMLDTLGYRPHPFRGRRVEARRREEDRAALVRIGVAGAIAINTMLASIALYSGWLAGMEPAYERMFRWICLLLVTPAVLWPGSVFFRGAWASVRTRVPHMDLPIAIALAAGYARGLWNTVTDSGPVYFDGIAMLVFLLLVGRFLQQRAQRAASDSAEWLFALSPATARLVEGAAVREVPVEALLPGMVVEVRGDETIPADGEVLEGRSSLDLSLLTGESRPMAVGAGAAVFAGTVNRGASIRLRVERAGEETRLGRLLREAEAGAARRAPIVALADRWAAIFVVTVIVLAAATLLLWWRSSPSFALDQAIALLIVTCPCALALATPLAVSVAIGRAARAGILIRNGAALETLSRPAAIFLDKTGTVTEGRMGLVRWEGPDEARAWVLALEAHSTHPLARGFEEAWRGLAVPTASEVVVVPGGGVEGIVSGRRVAVGSPAFVAAHLAGSAGGAGDGREGGAARDRAGDGASAEETPVHVAADGRLVATAGFGDRVREGAAGEVARLRERGFTPRLLSGDAPEVVRAAGAALGLAPD
ncbi:MAG TPA: heavy metal translocating P-type ATPase metal-binding domain-containing protein, partial [Candidatus Eisenbacteria bacterium]|nr:heavy metal translocating P-type ATPase metal-binding domain-containing protein [Candidatus Eisenbacteria bacterium]